MRRLPECSPQRLNSTGIVIVVAGRLKTAQTVVFWGLCFG